MCCSGRRLSRGYDFNVDLSGLRNYGHVKGSRGITTGVRLSPGVFFYQETRILHEVEEEGK